MLRRIKINAASAVMVNQFLIKPTKKRMNLAQTKGFDFNFLANAYNAPKFNIGKITAGD